MPKDILSKGQKTKGGGGAYTVQPPPPQWIKKGFKTIKKNYRYDPTPEPNIGSELTGTQEDPAPRDTDNILLL